MRYKMYAVVLASVLAIASSGCQAIRMSSCETGSAVGCASGACGNQASCGCQHCQNGMNDPSRQGGVNGNRFAGQGGALFGADGHTGGYGASDMGMTGGIDLSACPSCSQLGRPCATCLAPGGRLAGLAGGAAGKARGLLGNLFNRAAAHDCQTPYTQPFAESGLPGGPMTPTYGYPYYTTRAPRDFLMCTPPSIGP